VIRFLLERAGYLLFCGKVDRVSGQAPLAGVINGAALMDWRIKLIRYLSAGALDFKLAPVFCY